MPLPSPSAPVVTTSEPSPQHRPATASPPLRVTTDRPRKTFMSLLQGYEGTKQAANPVEATSLPISNATTPEKHHGQRDSLGATAEVGVGDGAGVLVGVGLQAGEFDR
ncbi:hypothetical protein FAIPA1_360041 [Frankia sp. AiPs1]